MKLEIKNLSFSFGDARVLNCISLGIEEGEFVGLMGPNGSGKTTLLRCLTRYLPSEARTILVDMKPIHTMSDKEIAKTFAVVPQTSATDFPFTAYDIVMMGRLPHMGSRLAGESKKDEAVVRWAFDRTGCSHLKGRRFSELSGGERQRVIIARALAQQPKVLLLDEPTVYLDISGQFEMMDLIRRLNTEDGLTIVAVLHDINMAARYSDRVVLLNGGRLEAFDHPDEVFTTNTIRAVYGVDVAVRKDPLTHDVFVMPRSPIVLATKRGRRIHVLCGGGSGGPIMRALVDSGHSVSVGVLNVLDSDYESATDLRVPIIAEVPFAQISDDMHAENLRCIDETPIVVVTPFPVGPGNFKNLEAAMYALKAGKRVYILTGSGESSIDFVGGKANAYLCDLADAGAVKIRNLDDMMQLIAHEETANR
ncbi:MAG: ABC transporter ATP-binding protein [Methanobacteriota archaeon]|nr:MAG: ABC transporter ATP-binding protein [Euryarchaeota archaeon]